MSEESWVFIIGEIKWIVLTIVFFGMVIAGFKLVQTDRICKTIDRGIERVMEGVESCIGE